MDFWGTVSVLFRRWYVTLTAFTLTVAVAFAIYSRIPTTYESDAVLVLTIPPDGGAQTSSKALAQVANPLLTFDKGLNMSAAIVVAALETPETAASLGVTPKADPAYTVNNGSANPETLTESPFVFVAATGTDPVATKTLATRVLAKAEQILAERQKATGAPTSTYIVASVVVNPTAPNAQHGGKLRSSAVALCMGTVVSLTAAFATESFAARNSRPATPAVSPLMPARLARRRTPSEPLT